MVSKPLTIVVFGATGDLFGKKLAPALLGLFRRGLLPEHLRIIGLGRRPLSDEAFQASISGALSFHESAPEILTAFGSKLSYVQGDSGDAATYAALNACILESDAVFGAPSDRLIYLAVAPHLYSEILRNLTHSGIAKPGSDSSFARILIEKPFGTSLADAEALNLQIASTLQEDAIFRVDHYLAKAVLGDLIRFRRAHPHLASFWSREHIERVEVRFFESAPVSGRGSFYDSVGAFLDVGQNHVLQLLSAALSDVPMVRSAAGVHALRTTFLKSLSLAVGDTETRVRRAQYDGYLHEAGVDPESKTETYFKIPLTSNLTQFEGVPILLEGGKAMRASEVSVKIYFKGLPTGDNVLTCRIQPVEELTIPTAFGAAPGDALPEGVVPPGAYERVFADALLGEDETFVGRDEAVAAWQVTAAILAALENAPMESYPRGGVVEDLRADP